MRILVVLCLVAVTSAENSGYSYQPGAPLGSGISGGSSGLGTGLGSGLSNSNLGSGPGAGSLGASFGGSSFHSGGLGDLSGLGRSLVSTSVLESPVAFLAAPQAALQTEFYSFSANNADFDEQSLERAPKRLNAIRRNFNTRPEVHFVKYRTPADAVNAQRAIQRQYDSLGGFSQAHDGGVVPILNFASQAPVRQANAQAPASTYLPSSILSRRS